jgi:acetolactate synthase-1/2/3 large subunit
LSASAASRHTVIRTDAFQECDALGITRPVTDWSCQIRDVNELSRLSGWKAGAVDTHAQFEEALDRCLSSSEPCLLDVRVVEQTNCFPMIPAGKSHNQIMLSEEKWYPEL